MDLGFWSSLHQKALSHFKDKDKHLPYEKQKTLKFPLLNCHPVMNRGELQSVKEAFLCDHELANTSLTSLRALWAEELCSHSHRGQGGWQHGSGAWLPILTSVETPRSVSGTCSQSGACCRVSWKPGPGGPLAWCPNHLKGTHSAFPSNYSK